MYKSYTVKEIIRENKQVVSIILAGKISPGPGQFVMLWIPGVDEKPFVISYLEKNHFGITIEEKGNFTKAVKNLKRGDKVGVRGPYGNGFKIKNNSIIVAGGLGIAPSLSILRQIKNSTIIQGAKTKELLLYKDSDFLLNLLEQNKNKIIYCTDDGTCGIECFTTTLLGSMLTKEVKTVYTCGPEIMMQKVFEICEKKEVECEASLERFMKCGIGICGSCCMDTQLVCKDGPVFNSNQLRKLTELGKFARIKSGEKVPIKKYYEWRQK